MTLSLAEDLTARWTPSPEQIAAANDAFADPAVNLVITGHFLADKEFGVWTDTVEVIHADTVYPVVDKYDDYRPAVVRATVDAAKLGGERPGTAAYTVHYGDDQWAVFEEILPPGDVLRYASKDGIR